MNLQDWQLVAFAVWFGQVHVSFDIVDEAFSGRIESESPAYAHGDVGHVAKRRGMMAHLDVGVQVAHLPTANRLNEIIGVLEFGLLTVQNDTKIDFLERVSESIAIAFNTAQDRDQIDQLLEETQRQAEELQAREEELRAANKELQEQAKALRTGQMRA